MRREWISRVLAGSLILLLPVFGVCAEDDERSGTRSAGVEQEVAATEEIAPQVEKDASRPAAETAESAERMNDDEAADETGVKKCEQLKRDQERKKDAVSIGENRKIKAGEVVWGDAVIIGGNLKLHGSVVGDAVCVGGRVHAGPEAVVCGDLVTVGGISEVDPQAYIGGQKVVVGGFDIGPFKILRHLEGLGKEKPHRTGWTFGLGERFVELVSEVVLFLFLLFIGFLMTVFLPRQMDRIEEHLTQDFPRSALLGVAMMVLVPIVGLVLLFTCVGIPFLPLLALAVVVTGALGYIAFSRVLGQRLLGERQEIIQILMGLLLLQSASILGCLIALPGGVFETVGVVFDTVGMIICLCAVTIGLGAVIYSRYGKRTLAESQAARNRNGESATRFETP